MGSCCVKSNADEVATERVAKPHRRRRRTRDGGDGGDGDDPLQLQQHQKTPEEGNGDGAAALQNEFTCFAARDGNPIAGGGKAFAECPVAGAARDTGSAATSALPSPRAAAAPRKRASFKRRSHRRSRGEPRSPPSPRSPPAPRHNSTASSSGTGNADASSDPGAHQAHAPQAAVRAAVCPPPVAGGGAASAAHDEAAQSSGNPLLPRPAAAPPTVPSASRGAAPPPPPPTTTTTTTTWSAPGGGNGAACGDRSRSNSHSTSRSNSRSTAGTNLNSSVTESVLGAQLTDLGPEMQAQAQQRPEEHLGHYVGHSVSIDQRSESSVSMSASQVAWATSANADLTRRVPGALFRKALRVIAADALHQAIVHPLAVRPELLPEAVKELSAERMDKSATFSLVPLYQRVRGLLTIRVAFVNAEFIQQVEEAKESAAPAAAARAKAEGVCSPRLLMPKFGVMFGMAPAASEEIIMAREEKDRLAGSGIRLGSPSGVGLQQHQQSFLPVNLMSSRTSTATIPGSPACDLTSPVSPSPPAAIVGSQGRGSHQSSAGPSTRSGSGNLVLGAAASPATRARVASGVNSASAGGAAGDDGGGATGPSGFAGAALPIFDCDPVLAADLQRLSAPTVAAIPQQRHHFSCNNSGIDAGDGLEFATMHMADELRKDSNCSTIRTPEAELATFTSVVVCPSVLRRLPSGSYAPFEFDRECFALIVTGDADRALFAKVFFLDLFINASDFGPHPQQALVSAMQNTFLRMSKVLARSKRVPSNLSGASSTPSTNSGGNGLFSMTAVYLRDDEVFTCNLGDPGTTDAELLLIRDTKDKTAIVLRSEPNASKTPSPGPTPRHNSGVNAPPPQPRAGSAVELEGLQLGATTWTRDVFRVLLPRAVTPDGSMTSDLSYESLLSISRSRMRSRRSAHGLGTSAATSRTSGTAKHGAPNSGVSLPPARPSIDVSDAALGRSASGLRHRGDGPLPPQPGDSIATLNSLASADSLLLQRISSNDSQRAGSPTQRCTYIANFAVVLATAQFWTAFAPDEIWSFLNAMLLRFHEPGADASHASIHTSATHSSTATHSDLQNLNYDMAVVLQQEAIRRLQSRGEDTDALAVVLITFM